MLDLRFPVSAYFHHFHMKIMVKSTEPVYSIHCFPDIPKLNWDAMRMAQNLQNLQVFGAALVSCHPQNVVL